MTARLTRFAKAWAALPAVFALAGVAPLVVAGPATAAPATSAPLDIFTPMADEVAAKMLGSPAFKAKSESGRKVKIVIGDVRNNSANESLRVDDIFNEIRNQIVNAGTARLFTPGELNVDFVISPELTSLTVLDRGRRVTCYSLQLTLTTAEGELVASHSAKTC